MIEKKSFMMALKRAFQTGTFSYIGQQAKQFPKQLCNIGDLQIDDQNWWECNPITKLDFSNNEIVQIPEEIAVLVDIQLIRMKNNFLKSLPKSILKLENLKALDVSKNKLTHIPPQFSYAPALVQINLSQNFLEQIGNLSNIKTLQNLFIDRNRLKSLPNLGPNIKKLQAHTNNIRQIRKSNFQMCNLIEYINLNKNVIEVIQPGSFRNASNLVSIQFKENRLTQINQIPESKKLDTISLGFNRLTTYEQFHKTPNLTVLILSDNKIKVLSKEIFKLSKLKTLDISNNDLSDLPCEIGFINSLVRIQVQGNPLRSIRQNIRTGGTNVIKKYLQDKMDPKEKANIQKQASTGFQQISDEEYWVKLVNQFQQNGQLILKNMNLKELSPIIFSKNLRGINLTQNLLKQISQDIANLQSLRFLIVCNNALQKLPTSLSLIRSLQTIDAKHNMITSFGTPKVAKNPYPSLNFLDLSANKIKTFPMAILQINKLRTLHLSYNGLSDVECVWNPNYLPILQILDLSNNAISEISDNVAKKPSLNYLNLQNNSLTKIPTIIGFMKLSGFKIDGNPLKLIKRTTIEKGTVAILQNLRNKHTGNTPEIPQYKPVIQQKEPIVQEQFEHQIKLNHPVKQIKPTSKFQEKPQKMDTEGKKNIISNIQKQISKLQNEIDSNMSMNNIQKMERKKKIQALMVEKNKLMKQ